MSRETGLPYPPGENRRSGGPGAPGTPAHNRTRGYILGVEIDLRRFFLCKLADRVPLLAPNPARGYG